MKEIDAYKMSIGMLLFLAAHTCAFFQLNLRFINSGLESKAIYLACICSIPITLLFYYGWGMTMEASSNSAWTSRFISFGVSYLVFPILTAVFLGESFFNTKTILCVVLSMLILYIQIFY